LYGISIGFFQSHHCVNADIDECAVNNGSCHTHADCINVPGYFYCTCRPGYTGDGFTCAGRQYLLTEAVQDLRVAGFLARKMDISSTLL